MSGEFEVVFLSESERSPLLLLPELFLPESLPELRSGSVHLNGVQTKGRSGLNGAHLNKVQTKGQKGAPFRLNFASICPLPWGANKGKVNERIELPFLAGHNRKGYESKNLSYI